MLAKLVISLKFDANMELFFLNENKTLLFIRIINKKIHLSLNKSSIHVLNWF